MLAVLEHFSQKTHASEIEAKEKLRSHIARMIAKILIGDRSSADINITRKNK